MDEKLIKRAVEEAQESLQEKQIQTVKDIVLKTLEKIDGLKKKRATLLDDVHGLDDQIKFLKMDIEDLKEGKLDRIVERQEKDEKARAISVVIIIKEKEVIREVSPWYWPYRITWQPFPPIYLAESTISVPTDWISSSVAYHNTAGSYTIGDDVIHLR